MEPDGSYGGLKNGHWTGMIRELRTQKADMAVIDMSITSIRQSAVDFTMPYMSTGTVQNGTCTVRVEQYFVRSRYSLQETESTAS